MRKITSSELTPIEMSLLSLLVSHLERIDKLRESVIESVQLGKYNEAHKVSLQLSYFEHDRFLKDLQNEFFDNASTDTLLKIAQGQEFKGAYGFSNPIIIRSDVLPKFSSYDKVLNNHPKAAVAKLLGATIVV